MRIRNRVMEIVMVFPYPGETQLGRGLKHERTVTHQIRFLNKKTYAYGPNGKWHTENSTFFHKKWSMKVSG